MQYEKTAVQQQLAIRASNLQAGKRYAPETREQHLRDAAELISAAHFWEADEARFMRTGGRRHYRVKNVDSRVIIAGSLAAAFVKNADKKAEEVWWAIANNHFDLTALERGAVALLKRKNELLEVVRNVHSLMPDIQLSARRAFTDAVREAE